MRTVMIVLILAGCYGPNPGGPAEEASGGQDGPVLMDSSEGIYHNRSECHRSADGAPCCEALMWDCPPGTVQWAILGGVFYLAGDAPRIREGERTNRMELCWPNTPDNPPFSRGERPIGPVTGYMRGRLATFSYRDGDGILVAFGCEGGGRYATELETFASVPEGPKEDQAGHRQCFDDEGREVGC